MVHDFDTISVYHTLYPALWVHLEQNPVDAAHVRVLCIGECSTEKVPPFFGSVPLQQEVPSDLQQKTELLLCGALRNMSGLKMFSWGPSIPPPLLGNLISSAMADNCGITSLALEDEPYMMMPFESPSIFRFPVGGLHNLTHLHLVSTGMVPFPPMFDFAGVFSQCPRLKSFDLDWGCIGETPALDVTYLLPYINLPRLQSIFMRSVECQPAVARDFFQKHPLLKRVEILMMLDDHVFDYSALRPGDMPNVSDWWFPGFDVMKQALDAIITAEVPVKRLHHFHLHEYFKNEHDQSDIDASLSLLAGQVEAVFLYDRTPWEYVENRAFAFLVALIPNVVVKITVPPDCEIKSGTYTFFPLDEDGLDWKPMFTPLHDGAANKSTSENGSDGPASSDSDFDSGGNAEDLDHSEEEEFIGLGDGSGTNGGSEVGRDETRERMGAEVHFRDGQRDMAGEEGMIGPGGCIELVKLVGHRR